MISRKNCNIISSGKVLDKSNVNVRSFRPNLRETDEKNNSRWSFLQLLLSIHFAACAVIIISVLLLVTYKKVYIHIYKYACIFENKYIYNPF